MYKHIMVPVDLAHEDTLDKAVATAADLAKHYGARLTLVGVTVSGPGFAASSPQEFERKLGAFADAQGRRHGVEITPRPLVDPDPAVDLDGVLREQVEALGADLVVMASHVPGLRDLIFQSHGGWLATHTSVSVFLVR